MPASRKLYVDLARMIRAEIDYCWSAEELVTKALVPALALDNPRFDVSQFLAACGIEES